MSGNLSELRNAAQAADILTVHKIIYASRYPKTEKQVLEILQLEIDTHLRKYPKLVYTGSNNLIPVNNSDRSQTYTLMFKRK